MSKPEKLELTKAQETAIQETRKNILVSAGAGAGKTRVLVERFCNFVIAGKAGVTEILTLTFMEKAANEMKSRIMKRFRAEGMLGNCRQMELAYISTLHAFAARLLKEHPIEACVAPDFSVIESEEAEFLQEQALDEVIEKECAPGSGVFELLKAYDEDAVREGVRKTLAKARIEGLTLKEFFERQKKNRENENTDVVSVIFREVAGHFEILEETELLEDWKRFTGRKDWDWEVIESFREWFKGFRRRGGKNHKETWAEIADRCQEFLGHHLDRFSFPWRERFETMALAFETLYEAKKFEKGVLDFEDLQLRALQLLTADHPGSRKILKHYRNLFKFVLVDEYQDINPLQARLIECFMPAESESGTDAKMFFVGDYKQSIYGFRGTSPAHFLEKEKKYAAGGGFLIEMMENFRTEKTTLNFINAFFARLWEEDGLENTGLIPKIETKDAKNPELLVVKKRKEENIDQARMREAGAIVRRMKELHEKEEIPYGKMTVLFQALSSVGIYEHALKSAGIPYFVVSGKGFYHQPEIRDMISLLSALENPMLDIPLAAALRSPFFRISDNALFWLSRDAKRGDENAPLYHALKTVESIKQISAEERETLKQCRVFFEELIEAKDKLYLSELLEMILKRTFYEVSILADRQGIRRFANLRKLVNLARDQETRERMSLGDFIRMIRGLESREIRESEAQVEAEESGLVVRLMTVHAAKGLEFPVCFVADLAHQGRSPENKTFLAETGMGYAFKIPNALTREMEEPGIYEKIKRGMDTRETEEWKRLFYVAMTRAKKRLILSGVYEEKKNPKTVFSEMSSWMEWVMTQASDLPLDFQEIPEDAKGLIVRSHKVLAEEDFVRQVLAPEKEAAGPETILPKERKETDVKQAEAIFRQLETYEAPASRILDLPVSAYCAYLKNPLEYWRIYEMGFPDSAHEREFEKMPEDEEQDISAADFGTRMHKALEVLDFKDPRDIPRIISEIFGDLEEKRRAEAEEILKNFLQTPLFKKLQSARRIYKEIPFVIDQRHGRIDGVIDVLFQESNGSWGVLDYKTASGDEKKVKEAAYDFQIAIYAAAVKEITGTVPAAGTLYFLKNSWSYEIRLSAEFLQKQLARARELQEEILEYGQSHTARPII